MHHRERGYRFHAMTTALCSECLLPAPAKVIMRGGSIYLRRQCPEHGLSDELLEEDAAFFLRQQEYDKPGSETQTETTTRLGCPYDCGLCPDHEQHTCIGLLEITQRCNLGCPICFAVAEGATAHSPDLSLASAAAMLDAYQAAEGGAADVLQISGGEPTLHPQLLDIIRLARAKGIRYVMLNTNGLRLADDPTLAETLSEFADGFEVYLQFDGFDDRGSRALRGRPLIETKRKALENLARHKVPATLVATVHGGVNDHELGAIVDFGMKHPAVRGVNFQPLAFFGRTDGADPAGRITRTGILKRLQEQTAGMIRMDDFVPLPCDVDRVAFCLLYRRDGRFTPITRGADVRKYLPLIDNTMAFYGQDVLKQAAKSLCGGGACSCFSFAKDLIPLAGLAGRGMAAKDKPAFVTENVFRISATSFLDRYTFELKGAKKECVHILTEDGRRMPFSAYNLIHREAHAHAALDPAVARRAGR